MSDECLDLGRHLLSFGIQQFNSDQYWSWGGKLLGPNRAERLNQLRQPAIDGSTAKEMEPFYDYISQPTVAKVVHSMKADAIRVSGIAAESALPLKGHVLELGCSIGYLTTYYGLRSAPRDVMGADLSEKTVSRARLEASKRKVGNVAFHRGDITESLPGSKFDAIVSTQVLGTIANRSNALSLVAQALSPAGILVSIEALGDYLLAESYVAEAAACGLRLTDFDFVYFSDLGEKGAYPIFKLALEGSAVSPDFSDQYERVVAKLRLGGHDKNS